MRLLLLICVILISQYNLNAQEQVMALRQSREQGFLFMDIEGKELFRLPPNHDPTVRLTKEPFKLGNFYTLNFSDRLVPVRNGEHHYLINNKGEKVHDLQDSLNWVSSFKNGFFRAYERYNHQRNTSVIVYLDADGKPCFNGTKYWEASPFKEGAALVQLDNGQGDWLIIDTLGQELHNISDQVTGEIRSYKISDRDNWVLNVKEENRYKKLYLRPDGVFSYKESDLMPPRDRSKSNAVPDTGLEVDQRIIDRINALPMFVFPSLYQNETYGYYLFEDKDMTTGREKMVVYDHEYNTFFLPEEEGVSYQYLEFRGRYLLIKKEKTDGSGYSFVFLDTKDMTLGLELEELPFNTRVEGELLFYETKQSFGFITVHKIVKLSGEVIYEPSLERTVFKDIDKASSYSDQVTELDLDGIGFIDLMQLPIFKNLETLRIKNGFGRWLHHDNFAGLTKFRSLYLTDCPKLTAFPEDLKDAKQLETIFIRDCPMLDGLEELIPHLESLKTIRSDYNFDEATLSELKKAYPSLQFEFLLVEVKEH